MDVQAKEPLPPPGTPNLAGKMVLEIVLTGST
jgi:hypothetical protein